MSEESKEFTVKDRRMFSDEKEPEEQTEEQTTASTEDRPAEEEPSAQDSAAGESQAEPAEEDAQLPEINFSTFVFSLNASALVNLGAIENPASGQKEKNLPLAKQTIDILGMLEEKTSGNLSDDEEQLLRNILYDLRLSYVKEKG